MNLLFRFLLRRLKFDVSYDLVLVASTLSRLLAMPTGIVMVLDDRLQQLVERMSSAADLNDHRAIYALLLGFSGYKTHTQKNLQHCQHKHNHTNTIVY